MTKHQPVDNKNTQVKSVTQADLSDHELARQAAKACVAEFYAGTSLPFKASVDLHKRVAVNFTTGDENTKRSAAGIAAILTYCDVRPDGTFRRGSGSVPGRLIGLTGSDADKMFSVGPESGLLSQLMSRGLHRAYHVSGPTHGDGAENAVYRLDFDACQACMRYHNGQHIFDVPLQLLRAIQNPPPAPALADSIPTIDEPNISEVGQEGEQDTVGTDVADSSGVDDVIRTNKARPLDEELAEIAEKIVDQLGGGLPTGTAEYRRKVEKAAVETACRYLKLLGYTVKDRQPDKCGYDLLARRKEIPSELHVEVKGTSLSAEKFFISRNEYKYMNNPKWRLALVTDALGKPNLQLREAREVRAAFSFEPMIFMVGAKEPQAVQ